MADDEAQEEVETQEPKEKKKSKSLIIIIIIVLILVITIGVVVAFVFMGGHSKSKASSHKYKRTKPLTSKNNIESQNIVSLAKVGILFPLNTFTVNLMSSGGQRYLKTQMSLELSNKDLAIELNAKKAVIRDKIIGVLSSKTFQEISTTKGKNRLSQQIINVLNPMLSDGAIQNVFFTQFIIQ